MTELDKAGLEAAIRASTEAAQISREHQPRVAAIIRAYLDAAGDWRPMESAPKDGSLYEVSQSGKIRVDGTLLHPYRTDKGYLRITLGGKSVPVHRLVAIAFIPNPRKCVEINHLDGNRGNNSADNLEWCTRSENMKHAYASGLHSGVALHGQDNPRFGLTGNKHAQSKPVRATFGDGTTKDYESQNLVAVDGYKPHKVNDCINGRRKSHGGATWRPLPSPPKEG